MAAFRLAAKGKTMADSSYDAEVKNIRAFLSMQHPSPSPGVTPTQLDINPEDYISSRYFKKLKSKQVGRLYVSYAIKLLHDNVMFFGGLKIQLQAPKYVC